MRKEIILSVFTPTYNRAKTLSRTYESLIRQTSKNFVWVIADDGSSDNTKEIVEHWKISAPFKIVYARQENQGMHGAHNLAYSVIDTELSVCIDSDDWMPDNAVEIIIRFWESHRNKKYAGFMGLDITPEGKCIGSTLPEKPIETTYIDFYENIGGGDKKLVYRTDVINKYPRYPIFKGEKYVGLSSLFMMIDQDYKLLTLNEPLAIVEYLPDGSSFNMYRQYWNNPKGFAYFRTVEMVSWKTWQKKFKSCIHYVSHSIRNRNARFLKETPLKIMTLIAIPFGVALYVLTKYKVLSGAKMKI